MLFCVITDYGNLSTIALSLKDPVSVKERRERFLQGLGLADSTNQLSCA